MKKIMLVGEPMGLFIAREEGPLEEVSSFLSATAGAELNVAIGLSRLENPVSYMTKLGNDPFGARIVHTLQKNGISTQLLSFSDEYSTGFMLKGKVRSGDPQIFYFRRNSAASHITVEDIDRLSFEGYGILHMTGIFPALSASTREAAFYLMEKARKAGLTISFDPNLRPQLWPDTKTMAQTLNSLAEQADYVLPGESEGEILLGTRDPKRIGAHYLEKGAKAVIVKTGKRGAYAASREENFQCPTYQEDAFVDTVGDGDGFAAGILSALNEGLSLREAVQRANAIGTIQIQSVGDNEGLPTREELKRFMDTHPFKRV